MSCSHPRKNWIIGNNLATNKPLYKYTGWNVDHVECVAGVWRAAETSVISPYASDVSHEFVEIPCGQCIDCRLAYSREWANRCMLELQDHDPENCWFLTLTFDDAHIDELPVNFVELIDGSDLELHSLSPRPLQLFWKSLRQFAFNKYGVNLRYYACGEYGDLHFRPHFHAIVYGLPLDDLEPWEKSKKGNILFRSNTLEKYWQRGIVCVSHVTWDTCAYTARYVMKKRKGVDADFLWNFGLMPEKSYMSRNPGIARNYFDENYKSIYRFDGINLSSPDGGLKIKPPRYYDSLYEAADPDAYRNIKIKRKESAERSRELKLRNTSVTYEELLKIHEQNMIARVKTLKREVF